MNTKHTQGKWRYDKHEDFSRYNGNITVELGNGDNGIMNIRTVATVLKYAEEDESTANGDFIATACNNHYELIKALELSINELEKKNGSFFLLGYLRDTLNNAKNIQNADV